jgi:hypothetical protein
LILVITRRGPRGIPACAGMTAREGDWQDGFFIRRVRRQRFTPARFLLMAGQIQ